MSAVGQSQRQQHRTTLDSRESAADDCRTRGWVAGTRLIGTFGVNTTIIEVTAVGERRILAKVLIHNGQRERRGDTEQVWALDGRDWWPVTDVKE